MPFDASKYPPKWREFSKRIREREGQRCAWCKAPNRQVVVRSIDGTEYMTTDGEEFRCYAADNGEFLGLYNPHHYSDYDRWRSDGTRIVLTVAHLNGDSGPCQCEPRCAREDHVVALCQRCHLRYDSDRHARNRRENRRKRLAARDLFEESQSCGVSTPRGR